jgi:hypothetical protein
VGREAAHQCHPDGQRARAEEGHRDPHRQVVVRSRQPDKRRRNRPDGKLQHAEQRRRAAGRVREVIEGERHGIG